MTLQGREKNMEIDAYPYYFRVLNCDLFRIYESKKI
jgi:hypothetical protein